MRFLFVLIAALFFSASSFAQTFPVKAPPVVTCNAGNCNGGYVDFGAGMDAALSSALTNGGSNNGASLNFGGGYQYWTGQVIAGIEVNGGYQFGTAGSTGSFTSTQLVKLGYNFFPSTQSAPATPSQNPFASLVPANILANSTPAIIVGGALGHGVEKAAIGAEIDSVLASGWSVAYQLYNAPSVKGQPDETVFRVMVQKHFNGL